MILHVKTDKKVTWCKLEDKHLVRVCLVPKFGLWTSGLGAPPTKNLASKHWIAGSVKLS